MLSRRYQLIVLSIRKPLKIGHDSDEGMGEPGSLERYLLPIAAFASSSNPSLTTAAPSVPSNRNAASWKAGQKGISHDASDTDNPSQALARMSSTSSGLLQISLLNKRFIFDKLSGSQVSPNPVRIGRL
jgi:hypothetical protein